ncbi:MAG: hypothetical protein PHF86_06770 [Candidatus Nanoarchaeia archaeon]|jgi:hypothetical protein|nr:hypothetical protein [Candidatus Nanoarchaeia archaeon]
MKKSVKTIADEVLNKTQGFESFIAEQIVQSKSEHDEEPCFTISGSNVTLDVWKKKKNDYELIKSVVPGSHKAGKDFRKIMKKKELIEEILKLVDGFLD